MYIFKIKETKIKTFRLIKIFFIKKMTILNSPTITTSAWIRRDDQRPLSGNGLRESKRNYNTEEDSIITGLVSTVQVGSHNLNLPDAWIGLEEESQKFLTTHDLGQAVVYMRASEIIVNSHFIRCEREAPIDVFNQIVFGGETDNARTIKFYRSIFLDSNNDYKTKFLYDWSLSTISSGYSLILGIVNGLLFLSPDDFFFHMDNWIKNLGHFCQKQKIPLRTLKSSNETRLLFGGFLFNRQSSSTADIHSLNFRYNLYHYEGAKSRSPLLLSIDRNSICQPPFVSQSFRSRVTRTEEGFLTTEFAFSLLGKRVTTLVMALDLQDAEDLCQEESPMLTSIGIQYNDGLVVLSMRQLPEFVSLDRNLRVDSACSDIFSDELSLKMIVNMSISSTGSPNTLFYNRFNVLNTTN